MKSWPWIVSACSLLLMVSAVEAQHVDIAKQEADTATKTAEAQVQKCSKCQGDFEQGFILDIQPIPTSVGSYKAPADWVQGTVNGGFLPGLKVKTRRQIVAFRCTNCGYLELYAH